MEMKLVACNFSRDGVDNLGKKPPTMGMSCIHINNISLPQYDAQKTEDLIGYSDIGLLLIKKMNPTIFRHASLRPYECLGGFGRDVRQ